MADISSRPSASTVGGGVGSLTLRQARTCVLRIHLRLEGLPAAAPVTAEPAGESVNHLAARRQPGEVPVSGGSLAHIVLTAIPAPGRPARHPPRARIYDLPAAHSDQLCAASGAWSPISGTAPTADPARVGAQGSRNGT